MTALPSYIHDILHHMDRACLCIDFDWKIIYATPLVEKILGISTETIIGRDLRDNLPDVVSVFYKTLNACLRQRKTMKTSACYGPTMNTLEVTANPTESGMLVYFRDTTETEETLAQLRDSETLYRAILETLNDGLVTIDESGLITNINQAVEDMFGYSGDELLGRNVSLLLPQHERKAHEDYTRYSDLNEIRIINQTRELFGMRKDGSTFPINLKVSPMRVENHYGYLGIISDITARKSAENMIIEEKNRAEQANKAKSEFLSSMSHELRTPLNAILGYAQLLEMNPSILGEQRENIEEIHKAGKHLLWMVEDILDFARLDAGKISINSQPVSLSHMLSDCITMLSGLSAEKGITTNIQARCNDYQLRADPVRLKQVLINLISNAIKYNREQGSIDVLCSEINPHVLRIVIADTGTGIENTRLGELFEPFNRLGKEGSSVQGSGIGLSICKQLVKAMSGEIGVESTAGIGSRFWIELPIVRPEV